MDKIGIQVSEPNKFWGAVLEFYQSVPSYQKNCRSAYLSGLYVGFIMSLLNAEAGFGQLSNNFWMYLATFKDEVPELRNYIRKIKALSKQSIALRLEDFLNPGFRHGLPGKYYSQGIFDAARMGIAVVPNWMGLAGKDVYTGTNSWLDVHFEWLKSLDERQG